MRRTLGRLWSIHNNQILDGYNRRDLVLRLRLDGRVEAVREKGPWDSRRQCCLITGGRAAFSSGRRDGRWTVVAAEEGGNGGRWEGP